MKTSRFLGLAVLLLSACAAAAVPGGASVTLRGPAGQSVPVRVEVADDDGERQLGLMNRTELPEGEGMIFVFPDAQPRTFWMKNTLIPLDIAYFAADGAFVSSATMTPCTADPCALYPSAGFARYALEVGEGALAKIGVGPAWRLDVSGILGLR